jgi:outer membrane protein W
VFTFRFGHVSNHLRFRPRSIEIRLPARFAVEADALYQRLGTSTSYSVTIPPMNLFESRARANSWEFPLLMKYYFRPQSESWQPFVGTGFAFRTISLHDDVVESPAGVFHQDFRSGLGTGAAISAGIRFQLGRIALSPQARYTYWGNSDAGITKNEATLLFGVSF